jgi:hypothetical protein
MATRNTKSREDGVMIHPFLRLFVFLVAIPLWTWMAVGS